MESKDKKSIRNHRYYLAHKEKSKEKTYEYRKLNKSKIREKQKQYSKKYQHNNLPKVLEKNKRWEKNNIDRRRKTRNKRGFIYRSENKDKIQQYNRNRRARKNNNGGRITSQEWENLKSTYDYFCLCCKKREPEIKLTLDHVIPLSMGGEHNIGNSQPLCRICNSSKGAKYIDYRLIWKAKQE